MPIIESQEVNNEVAFLSAKGADSLAAAGYFVEAIANGTEQLRLNYDAALERRLVQWRNEAFGQYGPGTPRKDWPPAADDIFAGQGSPPEIEGRQLNGVALTAGIQRYGSLIVRGLISQAQVARMVDGIDQAFAESARQSGTYNELEATPWYRRFPLSPDSFISGTRPWVESAGGVLLADSPRMTSEYANLLDEMQILPVIADYLGERPALSIAKTTLRRVPKTLRLTGWHQDGFFLGEGIRSVNLWLCLSHCGEDASGLDVVPKRFNQLVETGTQGAVMDWVVGDALVDMVSRDAPVVSPVFRPGDAMLFDEMLLHRTGIPEQMLHDRYAIESWFFAPSSYPMAQQPLFV